MHLDVADHKLRCQALICPPLVAKTCDWIVGPLIGNEARKLRVWA